MINFDLRRCRPRWRRALVLVGMLGLLPPAGAASGDDTVVQAREAFGRKDKVQLAAAHAAVKAAGHPLAMWVDYWELGNRLASAQQAELDAFYARWPGTYVEDRLRNDWLLELGRRRDWTNLVVEFPRFRMNDDREVTCYALLTQHLAGQDVRSAAMAAWYAQKELDDGCALLAATLAEARVIGADDIWHEVRLSVENNRPRAARAAAALLGAATEKAVAEALDNPARYLARLPRQVPASSQAVALVALLRQAASDPELAAGQLQGGWA
ncbi:MAG TPA: lytic transglycosylase domain-containing protein, partial [Rubrivivax sp.]|nr:lytic transglycosylase domain-containing protein [Rubrivivax sp.]